VKFGRYSDPEKAALAACRTHEIDGQNKWNRRAHFQQRNSPLLAISILLFHLSAKSDMLLEIANCVKTARDGRIHIKHQTPFLHMNGAVQPNTQDRT
jgi:hypothetical protein